MSVNYSAIDVIIIDISACQHARRSAWVVDTMPARVQVSVHGGS